MKYLSIILTLLSSSICFAHRDLETGIFLPRDLIGYSDGQSVYSYVNCKPIYPVYEAYETRPVEWSDGTTGNPDRKMANTKDEEAELGLLNEGMRYRDLETGTFLTRDPIGYADGPNIYCYVHCNPITSFDPLGLDNDLFSEFDLLNQSIQNSVPPGISCNIDGSSYGVYNPGQSMIDRIFMPLEATAAGIDWAANELAQGAVGWYDVGCATLNSIAWVGGEILSVPDTILNNVTGTDEYERMFAAQNTPIPYDDMIVGTLGMLEVSGTWLKGFRALDKIKDIAPKSTDLYRAVMPDELLDIQKSGQFINRGFAEGKYFTSSMDDAANYGKQAVNAFGDPPYTIIKTQVPNNLLPTPVSVDGGIPAFVLPNSTLPSLTPTVMPTMPIPGM